MNRIVLPGDMAEIAGHQKQVVLQFEERLAQAIQCSVPGAHVQVGQMQEPEPVQFSRPMRQVNVYMANNQIAHLLETTLCC